MGILKSLKLDLKWLGIFDLRLSVPYHRIPLTLILRLGYLSLMILATLTSFWYFLFEAKNLQEYSEVFLYSAGSCVLVIWHSISLYYRKTIEYFFSAVQTKIEMRMKKTKIIAVKLEYMRINNWIERQMHLLRLIYFKIYAPLFVFPMPCFNFYKYITANFEPESLKLIIPASFPFDWKTPHGYLFTWAIQVLELVSLIASGYGFLCFYGSFCTFLASFVGDIRENLIDLNDNIKSQRKRTNAETQFQVKKQFYDLIKFHVEAIQLTDEFSRFCSKYSLVFFIIDGAAISIALLQFNKSIQAGILVDVIRSFIVLCSALIWIYILCHFGSKVTSAYQGFSKSIYLCDWHLFPMQMRKYLPMMIMMSQKPIYMRGFGFNCTLETFKTIINISYKFFAVLKELA